MRKLITLASKFRYHILLWLIAALYFLLSPSLHYYLFIREGKPVEVWQQQPKEAGKIRHVIETTKFWSNGRITHIEGETYALWGWAFLNKGPNTLQSNFDRFAIIYDDTHSYIFPIQVYRRPDVRDRFQDLGLSDLVSSGFYSVISRNALPIGKYGIGLLFKQKQNGTSYYTQTNVLLVRSPNHLSLERKPK